MCGAIRLGEKGLCDVRGRGARGTDDERLVEHRRERAKKVTWDSEEEGGGHWEILWS